MSHNRKKLTLVKSKITHDLRISSGTDRSEKKSIYIFHGKLPSTRHHPLNECLTFSPLRVVVNGNLDWQHELVRIVNFLSWKIVQFA